MKWSIGIRIVWKKIEWRLAQISLLEIIVLRNDTFKTKGLYPYHQCSNGFDSDHAISTRGSTVPDDQ